MVKITDNLLSGAICFNEKILNDLLIQIFKFVTCNLRSEIRAETTIHVRF